MTESKFTLFVGDVVDKVLTQSKEWLEFAHKSLNKKQYKVSDTPLSYRKINYLDEVGALKSERKQNKGWRKFSFKELVYLSIVKELRYYGRSNESIRDFFEEFFKKEKCPTNSADIAMLISFSGISVNVVFDNQGNTGFYSVPMFQALHSKTKSFLSINLNEIMSSVWMQIKNVDLPYKDSLSIIRSIVEDFELDTKETELLAIIRNKDYKQIEVRRVNDDRWVVKASASSDTDISRLKELIEKKDFGSVTVQKKDGKIMYVKIEDTYKL